MAVPSLANTLRKLEDPNGGPGEEGQDPRKGKIQIDCKAGKILKSKLASALVSSGSLVVVPLRLSIFGGKYCLSISPTNPF